VKKSVYQNATDFVEIKREQNMFSVFPYTFRQTLCHMPPLSLFIFPSPLTVTQLKLGVILLSLYADVEVSEEHNARDGGAKREALCEAP
jgi:hypothetical protein